MTEIRKYEVAIIGGSYAGLSAAMALGRARRDVLIVDGGDPCNKQTPHSHNFLTQDGVQPAAIASIAREQVLRYPTVQLVSDLVRSVVRMEDGSFQVEMVNGYVFSKKIILATGVRDVMPPIPGFSACWGKTIIHCPYCHGYEVRDQKTGIMVPGEMALELVKLISHWTADLTLFLNGAEGLPDEDRARIQKKRVRIVDQPISQVIHESGALQHLRMDDGTEEPLTALYARVPMEQKSPLAHELGCAMKSPWLVEVDMFGQTSVKGVYAVGDCAQPMRSVATAVASGNIAGAMVNKELIEEAL